MVQWLLNLAEYDMFFFKYQGQYYKGKSKKDSTYSSYLHYYNEIPKHFLPEIAVCCLQELTLCLWNAVSTHNSLEQTPHR